MKLFSLLINSSIPQDLEKQVLSEPSIHVVSNSTKRIKANTPDVLTDSVSILCEYMSWCRGNYELLYSKSIPIQANS